MLQKSLYMLTVVVLLTACNSNQTERVSEDTLTVEASISDLLGDPLEFDNRSVKIEGVISHVCRHSGDKMRIMQDGSDLSILVMLGDFTGQFDTESEGMRVSLEGLLVTEVTNFDELEAHSHEGEDHDCESTLEAVEAMKAKGLDATIHTHIALNQYEAR